MTPRTRQLLLLAFAGSSVLLAVSGSHQTRGASAPSSRRPTAVWTPPVTVSGSRTSAFNPRAAVAAGGRAVVVWTSANGIEYTCCRNVDFRVQAAVRRRGGAFQSARAVSAPVRFTSRYATVNTRADDLFHADASVDAFGQPVAIWLRYSRRGEVRVEGATLGLDGRPRFVEALSSFGGVEGGGAELAADSAGNVFAVWESGRSESPRVETATRPPGERFRDRAVIGPENGDGSARPEVASVGDGTALAVWADASQPDEPAQVHGAFRRRGGAFEPARPISAIGAEVDPAPVVAMDPAGRATVVWGRSHEDGGWIEFSRAQAGGFAPQERLSPRSHDVDSARVTSMPDGTSVLVWEAFVQASETQGVYARTVTADGQLGPVETLTTVEPLSTVYGLAPQLAVDFVGNAFVIWRQPDHGRSKCCFRATAAIRPAGGSFGRPTVLSRPRRNARHPYIAAAPDGNAIAVWERFDGSHWRIEASSVRFPSPG
jgi:hypothetical protein